MGASQIDHKHNECNHIYDLNPTSNNNYYNALDEDDDKSIVTSNTSQNSSTPTDVINKKEVNTSLPTRGKAWKKIIELERLKETEHMETIFNTSSIKIAVDQAIADAGATGHFMVPGAPVIDVKPTNKPLIINLPDGETIKSTHTCRLNIPWLPEEATRAHIVPGLAHTSLVSISVLCDAGCKVSYDGKHCLVHYKQKIS